jgi:3-oxoadipate enol-lactonase/4-carboxymuconolactone decarboxylase
MTRATPPPCEALAEFDVRTRLPEIAAPLLAVAGAHDATTPAPILRHLAAGVQQGRLVSPRRGGPSGARRGARPTRRIDCRPGHHTTPPRVRRPRSARKACGSDEMCWATSHVDRALEADDRSDAGLPRTSSPRTPGAASGPEGGLDRRSRSLVTLAALVARGHHEELAMHFGRRVVMV